MGPGDDNSMVGARFVASFADPTVPLKGEDMVALTVLPLQGEVPAEQAEGAHGPEVVRQEHRKPPLASRPYGSRWCGASMRSRTSMRRSSRHAALSAAHTSGPCPVTVRSGP